MINTNIVQRVRVTNIRTTQLTQNICITIIQCWTNVEDVGPTLYKCYTNVLCLLGMFPVNIGNNVVLMLDQRRRADVYVQSIYNLNKK